MHLFTHSDVKKSHEKTKGTLKNMLRQLEDAVRDGRDRSQFSIPVYLTKWRIKTVDSTYLKVRRKRGKYKSLGDITDCGGMRVLSLFEADILPIHKFLLEALDTKHLDWTLKECIVYNWSDAASEEKIKKSLLESVHYDYVYDSYSSKASGYKSIHYVVCAPHGTRQQEFNIEIQLRTLLQDVWSELEHALAYKQGSIHPYIRKSFQLLARDLETSDLLISHLREISEKESSVEEFTQSHQGPCDLLHSTDRSLPTKISSIKEVRTAYDIYRNHVEARPASHDLDETKIWASRGLQLCTEIPISRQQLSDPNVNEWVCLEEAEWLFHKRRHDEALKKYELLIEKGSENYIVYFRAGELNRSKGLVVDALRYLDQCESLLNSIPSDSSNPASIAQVNVWIANTYWLMGEEYIHIALEKILRASATVAEYPDLVDEMKKRSILNNVCWYQLETFLLAKKQREQNMDETKNSELQTKIEQALSELIRTYEELRSTDDDEYSTSNQCDTLAWCSMQLFYHTGDSCHLDRARRYCDTLVARPNISSNSILSANMHKNHIQEIVRVHKQNKQ